MEERNEATGILGDLFPFHKGKNQQQTQTKSKEDCSFRALGEKWNGTPFERDSFLFVSIGIVVVVVVVVIFEWRFLVRGNCEAEEPNECFISFLFLSPEMSRDKAGSFGKQSKNELRHNEAPFFWKIDLSSVQSVPTLLKHSTVAQTDDSYLVPISTLCHT